MRLKRRVWDFLEIAKPGDAPSRAFDVFILVLILLNVIAVVVGTVKPVEERFAVHLHWFELFSLIVFSIEYVARVWACVSVEEYSHPIIGRLKFMLRPMSLIDLIAVLPFYLPFVHADLRFIRVLRLFRIFRVAKLGRYSSSARLFGRVLKNSKEELLITSMAMMILIVLASSFMYFAESEAQPDKFANIPSSMWWAVATLSTVGYGDVYPVTTVGKLFAAIISILGIGMFALPTAVLGANFVQALQRQKATKTVCPHCGRELE